jgi:hypothetical protein
MAATREQVMQALLTQLATITAQGVALKAYGRRLRDPENVPGNERPALFLVEHLDGWKKQAVNLPPVRELTVWALLYTDVGTNENAIPMTQVNYFIEAIETALKPDMPMLNRFTLGGLVFNCMLDGEGLRAAGDTTGKSVAALPIKIILP